MTVAIWESLAPLVPAESTAPICKVLEALFDSDRPVNDAVASCTGVVPLNE